ncbi:hypothetical protein ACFLRF_06080 [Candidatus Altiarchaeota archaeon]
MKTKKWAMLTVLVSTVFASFGTISLKMGSHGLTLNPIDLLTNYPLMIGVILYGLGATLLIVSLKHGELSVLYPIYALNFVWVSILSPVFYAEDSMNQLKWGGIIIIMVGVSLIGYGSNKGVPDD